MSDPTSEGRNERDQLREAAKEIDRLRAALEDIRDHGDEADEARRALGTGAPG